MDREADVWSSAFFHSALATGDSELITEMLTVMNKNILAVESDINSLVFHMNGGLDYDDAFLLTIDQRRNMANMVQKHYESQNPNKKSQL